MTHPQPTERSRALANTLQSTRSIGQSIIAQKKAEILAIAESDAKGDVEKRKIQGRDLLTLLIKANMATDIPDSARMTDEDILARKSKSGYDVLCENTDKDALRRGSNLPDCWP